MVEDVVEDEDEFKDFVGLDDTIVDVTYKHCRTCRCAKRFVNTGTQTEDVIADVDV